MQINIEKRHLSIILAIIIFLAGVILVIAYTQPIPNPGHGGDTILIKNSTGAEKTLQSAIDQGDFRGPKGDTGSQGPAGPQGPVGPTITTFAVCTDSSSVGCTCAGLLSRTLGPCTVTSDTGSCSSSLSGSIYRCCVCKPA